jgi:hypothetical protein
MLRPKDYTLFDSAIPRRLREDLRDPCEAARFLTTADRMADKHRELAPHEQNYTAHLFLSWAWHNLRCLHLYIDPGILEFSWNATKSNYMKLKLPALPSITPELAVPPPLQEYEGVRTVFIHFPRKEAPHGSLGIFQRPDPAVEDEPQLHYADSQGVGTTWAGLSMEGAGDLETTNQQVAASAYHRVAAMLLYLDAFPDMIRDPLPNQRLGKVSGILRRVEPDPEMVRERTGVSGDPHFRRGHYRTYRAARYKKVRGQTLWVRDAMIKGKAKEVVM